MATYGVVEKASVRGQNVDALNRNVKCASIMENGYIGNTLTWGTVANNESEVAVLTQPATGVLDNLWMVAEDPINITADKYRNLDPDPRNFRVAIGRTATAFMPQVGDKLRVNADFFSAAITTETYANATNATWQLVPGGSQTASVLSFRIISTDYISIGLGTLGTQRITGYLIDCVGVA